ncbi:MAG TPA: DUF58 domain-containing protein [Candidatus Thermoplasmatota archaeon]|nr:DUF58 domain-containing protein [Candidatus Thermoplasmatota archaeon]
MLKLTRAGVALATTGLALLALGMGMGNVELLVLASIPLLLLVVSLTARAGGAPVGARTLSTRTPRRGDTFDVELRVRPPPSSDITEVHQPVPEGFSLVAGSNVALLAGPAPAATRFRLCAHARGAHALPAATAERIDPRGLVAARVLDVVQPETLHVTPRALSAERLRRRARGRGKLLLPDRQEVRVGAGSTDFRELREYFWGDPPKAINWKATARRLSRVGRHAGVAPVPLVNEYEKEGRATVLILLDGGADMRVGTKLETGLDHGVEGALSAARLFLARGARVGAATFGAKAAAPAAPDAGSGQMHSVERALAPGEPDADASPLAVLSGFERHLAGSRPILLVLTRLTPRNAEEIAELVRRVRALSRQRRRRPPVFVIDLRALELAPTPAPGWDAARRIVEAEDAAAAREVVQAGARVIPWHPTREDFRAALFRRALA